jgi:hypothetical protein
VAFISRQEDSRSPAVLIRSSDVSGTGNVNVKMTVFLRVSAPLRCAETQNKINIGSTIAMKT